MQYYIIVIPFLVSLSALRLHAYSSKIFAKDTTIAHPETDLFLDYVGLYTPSEKIIHTSAIFPMPTYSCHFLPSSAAENIPSYFLSPEDIRKVVYNVIKLGNLTFNSYPGSLPVVQIITKLLVRQQIDFISKSQYITNDPEEIGRLAITNLFAVPQQEQIPFYIYKLLKIPFFHENETIELAQMPRHWAINSINNTTMEWHHPEESGCDLRLMTSCRDTPPIRTISKDTCLNQITERLPLSRYISFDS
ncbi:unnamed protein product [Rotaria socialis]|uniref:Uncharacterized protein n=1 Tax=Rotaria socialis TaxID=392032 RepID=A0A820Q7W0_9BILA|nr:unnamed protein product [Rotaria socialis]CAF4418540.1 unnamed protein product [Rotaria socialis]